MVVALDAERHRGQITANRNAVGEHERRVLGTLSDVVSELADEAGKLQPAPRVGSKNGDSQTGGRALQDGPDHAEPRASTTASLFTIAPARASVSSSLRPTLS